MNTTETSQHSTRSSARRASEAASHRLIAGLLAGLIFYAATLRGLSLNVVLPWPPTWVAWTEAAIDSVLVMLALWLMTRAGLLSKFASRWRRNWPLVLFIGFAAASILWSAAREVTITRVVILACSSVLGAWLAQQYSEGALIEVFGIFFGVVIILSAASAILWPLGGRMDFYPYYGSWRGVLWHRNYLGSSMALASLTFLCGLLLTLRRVSKPREATDEGSVKAGSRSRTAWFAVFYALSIVLTALSRSATGVILLLVLHALVAGILLWLRFQSRLHARQYAVLSIGMVLALTLGYWQLDRILGLFNRESNFTGRTGLWSYLLENVISLRPWLGHGFGALWNIQSFRIAVQQAMVWPYEVRIGDNGFVDILLHLGYIGLGLFVLVLAWASFRMARHAFRQRTLLAFFPILVMSYVVITNITLSYFLETESFTWILLVAVWFVVTPPAGATIARTPS